MISTEIHKSGYNLDAVLCSVAQSCQALCDPMDYSPPGSSVHGNSPGKNTGVGCHALLQWIFPSQGIKPKCPALEADSFCLSHQGSPRILEWVTIPSPGDLPNPGIKPGPPALQVDSLSAELPEKAMTWISVVITYLRWCLS